MKSCSHYQSLIVDYVDRQLAGVQARIASIEEKLKGAPAELGRKLADLKVSADIDLASLAAQQKVLDGLIDGQRRAADLAQLKNQIQPLKAAIEAADEGLKRCNEILADAKPFDLIDDTVVIRPVRFQLQLE